jgi:hypothetical protein
VVVVVGRSTLRFAVADEDRAILDELVEYFGHGSRSAYLRATLKIMKSVKLAEELRELQVFGQGKLGEQGLTVDDIPQITRRVLKARS